LEIISYTWRGKLKLSAGISRLLAAIAVLCLFCVFSAALFAQDKAPEIPAGTAPTPEIPVETTTEDRIAAAERALPLGDDMAGGAAAPPAASALSILRILLTLVVVAAAIYGLVFLVKRFARGSTSRDPFLKILASAPLGTNRSAYIISVGSRAWLVGAAESGVNLISEIGDKEILDALLLEDSRKNAGDDGGPDGSTGGRFPDFKSLLRRLGVPVDSAPPGPEDIRKRGERLKGL
jgi:flagellar protein FliO/FliZ